MRRPRRNPVVGVASGFHTGREAPALLTLLLSHLLTGLFSGHHLLHSCFDLHHLLRAVAVLCGKLIPTWQRLLIDLGFQWLLID